MYESIIRTYESIPNISATAVARKLGISKAKVEEVLFKSSPYMEARIESLLEQGKYEHVKALIERTYRIANKEILSRIPDSLLTPRWLLEKYVYLYYDLRSIELGFFIRKLGRIASTCRKEGYCRTYYCTLSYLMSAYIHILSLKGFRTYTNFLRAIVRLYRKNRKYFNAQDEEYRIVSLTSYLISDYYVNGYNPKLVKRLKDTLRNGELNHDLRNLVITRLRLVGAVVPVSEDEPNHVLSNLYAGKFKRVRRTYAKYFHSSSSNVKNRLDVSMFFIKVMEGDLEGARKHLVSIARRGIFGITPSILGLAWLIYYRLKGEENIASRIEKTLAKRTWLFSMIRFGKVPKGIELRPDVKILRNYLNGRLNVAYTIAKNNDHVGWLKIIILIKPKHIDNLLKYKEFRDIYYLLSNRTPVEIYFFRRKPFARIYGRKLFVGRKLFNFLLKLLYKGSIRTEDPRSIRFPIGKICKIVKTGNGYLLKLRRDRVESDLTKLLSGRKVRVEALPFVEDMYRDNELEEVWDKIIGRMKEYEKN